MMDYILTSTSPIVLLIILLGLISFFFRRYWKLRHVPGPFLASLTDLWRAYMQTCRPMLPYFLELHQKYGPVVRIGPNTLSISDPACVNVLYSNRVVFLKADSYRLLGVFLDNKSTGSLMDMQDEEQNRNMRKALGPAFLTRNILDYEPDVDTSLHDLIQRISQHPTFNLYNTLQFFQLDVLMKMAFSESPGHLIQGKDVLGLAKQGTPRLRHFYNWQAIPHIEAFIFRNPVWSRFITSQTTKWAKSGVARLNARKASGRLPGRDDLLQKYIDISEKHPDTIRLDTVANLVKSTISAGGDTTAAMMTSLIYFLLKNPQAYEKLQQELDQAVTNGALSRSSPRYSELSTLPYLDAVYKETLRLNPPIAAPLERVVPKGGAVLAGVHVPEGTIVGCVGRIIHLDKDWYGQDSEQFRPDRWLEDPKQTVLMDRAWMPFGNGNRICLGKHIVELELKKVMAALLLNFRMSLCDPSVELPLDEGMLECEDIPIMARFDPRQ